MFKDLLFEKEELKPYKKEWSFKPEWMLTGLNTDSCIQWLITKPEFSIGKGEENDGVLRMSRMTDECRVIVRCCETGCYVEAADSTSAVKLNGTSIADGEQIKVKNGDVLQIAASYLLVEKINAGEP